MFYYNQIAKEVYSVLYVLFQPGRRLLSLVPHSSFRYGLQMPSVRALSIGFRAFHEFFLVNEPIDISNFFRCRNHDALAVLDVFDEVARLQKRGHDPGVKPGKSAAEDLHVQQAVLQIRYISLSVVISSSPRAEG